MKDKTQICIFNMNKNLKKSYEQINYKELVEKKLKLVPVITAHPFPPFNRFQSTNMD